MTKTPSHVNADKPGPLLFAVYRWCNSEACPLSWRARVVLGVLADCCGTGVTAWPSEDRVARCMGISNRTVERGVAELRAAGVVEVARQPGGTWGSRPNVYTVNRPMIEARTDSPRLTGGMSSTQTDSQALNPTDGRDEINSTRLAVKLNPTHSRTHPDSQAEHPPKEPPKETPKEEEGRPPPRSQSQDVVVFIPCRQPTKGPETPEAWPLTPDERDRLEALHPGVDAVVVARGMVRKIEKGTWEPDTFRATPKRLAAWMTIEAERGKQKRPGMAPNAPDDFPWSVEDYREFGKDPDYEEYFDHYSELMGEHSSQPWPRVHVWRKLRIYRSADEPGPNLNQGLTEAVEGRSNLHSL